jgi:hypothetical protein
MDVSNLKLKVDCGGTKGHVADAKKQHAKMKGKGKK